MFPSINILGFELSTYSILIVIGVFGLAVSYIYFLRKVKLKENDIDKVFFLTIIAGIFTYLGASFFDTLWHCISLATIDGVFDPSKFVLDFNIGGITYEGGILTGFVAYLILRPIFLPKDRFHTLFYTDQIIPGLLFAHGLGRIGCYLAGCCYGKPTDSIFGVMYPTDDGMMKVFPTQLYEAFFLLICAVLFFFFIKKNRTEKYFLSYGIFRFFLEYLRGDNRGSFPLFGLSPSQFMSIVMIIIGILCIVFREVIKQKEIKNATENTIPVVRYFDPSYKHMFKILKNKKNCPICFEQMKLSTKSKIEKLNAVQAVNKEHFIYFCKKCNEKIEVE